MDEQLYWHLYDKWLAEQANQKEIDGSCGGNPGSRSIIYGGYFG